MNTDELMIEAICRDVCELPDRTSPEDAPDMVMVTLDELANILRHRLAALEAERDAGEARVVKAGSEMAVALHGFVGAGCNVCGSDCGSANPPVQYCPMQEAGRVVRNWNAALRQAGAGVVSARFDWTM